MKDIKSLYLAAKNSGKTNDISAYAEAVNEMFENSPNDYISNLEYIIQSDVGIRTLTEFVNKYGLPISCFDTVMESLETCIAKCNRLNIDPTLYQEAVDYMQSFRQKYIGCFMMESFFNDNRPDDYIKTYYGVNESGVPNRKLAAGLLEKFQEYAIPDVIVTANNIGESAMETVLGYIESHSTFGLPATCEWVLECVRNLMPESNGTRLMVESKASSGIFKSLKERNHQCYREAVITGNDDIMLEYSQDEINAIQDLISINEYKMTWADELNESASDIQKTIYSLYEEFADMEDDDGVLMTEAANNTNTVAKKIAGNIGKVRKEVLKLVKPVIREMVRSHNKDSGFFNKIEYPLISVMVRDQHGDEKTLVKRAIKKNLDDILYTDKEFIKAIHLGIRFTIDSATRKKEKKSIDLFIDAMMEALSPLIKTGQISFNHTDAYYYSVTYWTIPIYISKERMLDGVDTALIESGIDFEEFVADSVIPMLPGASTSVHPMQERPWLVNTRNKKTGDIPGYIKRNHNLGYGEDDGPSDHGTAGDSSSDVSTVDAEPTLDDFKRPSAEDMSTPYSGLDEPKEEPEKEPEKLTPAEQKAINNYYYYTYNNSLNKNTTGSFNRDHSTHTSTSTKKTVDDHSKNKRVNSDNINTSLEDEDEFKPVGEKSRYPWELDIFGGSEILYAESSKIDKTKLGAFINNRKKNRKKPDIKVVEGCPVPKKDYTDILKRIDAANDQLKNIIKKYDDKYPIYGLKVVYDKNIQSYGLGDGFEGLGVRKIKNYSMFEDLGDEYIFDIGYLLLSAFKVSEFVNNLKNKYPDEYKKLQSEFDLNPAKDPEDTPDPEDTVDLIDVSESTNHADKKDHPIDWANAMNSYKFLDYDKNLMEVWAYIGMDILKEIKGSLNYDSWSGEEYAWYGFYISAKTLYPEFNEKEIQRLKIPVVSNFAKSLPKKMKAIYFKEAGLENSYTEEVGDADKDRPQSDHPVKDILTDVDRALVKKQQGAKRVVQNVQNAGRAFVKPAVRTTQWVDNMVHNWKDADENSVKEKMADPHARSNLFSAIRSAIVGGSLLKAGLLLNPVFLGLTALRGIGKNKKEFRIRNEMIGELKTEMEIIDEKIKDADRVGDNKAKYKLMRFKNELNKKLLRVGGPKGWKKMI